MECNVHGFELSEAITEVLLTLKECDLADVHNLEIIHGYTHGQVLKNYFSSAKFLTDMSKQGYHLKRIPPTNPAKSKFQIVRD